jgi:hypothetical protein
MCKPSTHALTCVLYLGIVNQGELMNNDTIAPRGVARGDWSGDYCTDETCDSLGCHLVHPNA